MFIQLYMYFWRYVNFLQKKAKLPQKAPKTSNFQAFDTLDYFVFLKNSVAMNIHKV